jgi:hypothetical protein
MFAILFHIVQNNSFVKPFELVFLYCLATMFWPIIVRKIRFFVVSYFWWMETSKEVNFFKSLCQVFLYRELRCSLVTLYKDCDSILLSCFLLSNQKCSTVKGDSADWAYAMPRDQSVCRVGLPLRDENLSNCVDLKETLGSLKQFKVSDEMSRNVF